MDEGSHSQLFPHAPGAQFMTGAHHFSIGRVNSTVVGRDNVVTNIYNHLPSERVVNEKEELLKWLDGHDFRRIYRSALTARLAGTGVWFIRTRHFRRFVEGDGIIVWGTGLPGSGKTILASTSTEHLEVTFRGREGVAVVPVFLLYSEKVPLRDVLTGMLCQLIRSHESAYSCLLPVYGRHKVLGDRLSEVEASAMLGDIVKRFKKVYIVVDGLDEAEDRVKAGLLRILASLGANALITCRPLDLFKDRYTPTALHIPVKADMQDIAAFIADKIAESPRLQMILEENQPLRDMLSARIMESSKGMFLLARLQVETLMRKAKSISSLTKALNELPEGVNALYRSTMERINAQSEEDTLIAHRVFLWLLHAQRHLLVEDLQYALAVSFESWEFDADDLSSPSFILSVCGGLVTMDRLSGVVQFIHYTAQEFMETVRFPKLPSPPLFLALTCVACVEHHLCTSDSKRGSLSVSATSNILLLKPFLKYAYDYWGHHARDCDENNGDPPHPRLCAFLANCTNYPMTDRYSSHRMVYGLHLAAVHGLAKIIRLRTIPFPPKTCQASSPFHYAAMYGQAHALNALLTCYEGVNAQDDAGETVLHYAVRMNYPAIVQQLISFSGLDESTPNQPNIYIDVNIQNIKGETPLIVACSSSLRSQDIVRSLVSHHDLDVDLTAQDGCNAFWHACRIHSGALARILISAYPNLKIDSRNRLGTTAFMNACLAGLASIAGWMLSRKSLGDPDLLSEVDTDGHNAFIQVLESNTASSKLDELADMLMSQGTCVYALDDELSWDCSGRREQGGSIGSGIQRVSLGGGGHAALRGPDIGKEEKPKLLSFRISPVDKAGRCGEKGRTALMSMCGPGLYWSPFGDLSSTISYILSPEVEEINAQDGDGRTALMYASHWGNTSAVDALLSFTSLDVGLRDYEGLSALDYALFYAQRSRRRSSPNDNRTLSAIVLHPSCCERTDVFRGLVVTAASNPQYERRTLQMLFALEPVRSALYGTMLLILPLAEGVNRLHTPQIWEWSRSCTDSEVEDEGRDWDWDWDCQWDSGSNSEPDTEAPEFECTLPLLSFHLGRAKFDGSVLILSKFPHHGQSLSAPSPQVFFSTKDFGPPSTELQCLFSGRTLDLNYMAARDAEGRTPMMLAICSEHPMGSQTLDILRRSSPRHLTCYHDENGHSALHLAMMECQRDSQHLEFLKMISDTIAVESIPFTRRAILEAARNSDITLKCLLELLQQPAVLRAFIWDRDGRVVSSTILRFLEVSKERFPCIAPLGRFIWGWCGNELPRSGGDSVEELCGCRDCLPQPITCR